MKKIYGLSALALTLAMASCSSEEPMNNGMENGEKTTFINVKLFSTTVGTRADGNTNNTDQDFQYGTEDENKVNSLLLGFYTAGGNLVELVAATPTMGSAATTPGNVEVTGTVQVGVLENTMESATQMVAYVNIPAESVYGKSLSEVNALTFNTHTPGEGFAMTNSGYYNGDTYTITNAISSADFYKIGTADTEKPAPVNIYVERIASKVQLDEIKTIENYIAYAADGNTEVELTFTPTNWDVQATAKSVYALKQAAEIDGQAWYKTGSTNFRSYWAKSVNYAANSGFLAAGYDPEENLANDKTLNYRAYSEIEAGEFENNKSKSTVYALENTFKAEAVNGTISYNPWSRVTSIVLAGTYTTNSENFTEGSSFYLRPFTKLDSESGQMRVVQQILDEDEIYDVMLSAASYIKKGGEALTKDDVELVYLPGVNGTNPASARYIQLKSTDGEFTINGATGNGEDVNAKLAAITPARYYYEGKAFFYVPLRHYVSEEQPSNSQYITLTEIVEGNYGIVRNNWYVLTINSITGLATAAGDDTDIPVPDPEVDQYAIDATLNVLQWHMRNQTVDL